MKSRSSYAFFYFTFSSNSLFQKYRKIKNDERSVKCSKHLYVTKAEATQFDTEGLEGASAWSLQ